MTSSDVRAILNLPLSRIGASSSSAAPLNKKTSSQARKPDGISRELYALIGDNAPSLAQAQASLAALRYRDRPTSRSKAAHWDWVASNLKGAGRAVLHRWVREDDATGEGRSAYFSQFNANGPSVLEYSQFEYDQLLTDPSWTPHETAYLFDLLRQYDLRFVVAADRYDYMGAKGEGPSRRRSIEEMKERYYNICRQLVRTRTASDPHAQQQLLQSFAFDKAREIKRKQYASAQFHLTSAEIAEEEALFIEIKRLEQNELRYRSDRDNLMRTIIGLDSGLVNLDQVNSEGVVGVDRNKKRRRPEDADATSTPPVTAPSKKQRDTAAFDLAHCIHRLDTTASGLSSAQMSSRHTIHTPAFLRSTRIPTPKSNATIRIEALLQSLGVSAHRLVMPTRENIEVFDRLLLASGGLTELKRQVDRVEQEIRTLEAQKEGFVPSKSANRKSGRCYFVLLLVTFIWCIILLASYQRLTWTQPGMVSASMVPTASASELIKSLRSPQLPLEHKIRTATALRSNHQIRRNDVIVRDWLVDTWVRSNNGRGSATEMPMLSEGLYKLYIQLPATDSSKTPPLLISKFCGLLETQTRPAVEVLSIAVQAFELMFQSVDRHDKLDAWLEALQAYLAALASPPVAASLSPGHLSMICERLARVIARNTLSSWSRLNSNAKRDPNIQNLLVPILLLSRNPAMCPVADFLLQDVFFPMCHASSLPSLRDAVSIMQKDVQGSDSHQFAGFATTLFISFTRFISTHKRACIPESSFKPKSRESSNIPGWEECIWDGLECVVEAMDLVAPEDPGIASTSRRKAHSIVWTQLRALGLSHLRHDAADTLMRKEFQQVQADIAYPLLPAEDLGYLLEVLAVLQVFEPTFASVPVNILSRCIHVGDELHDRGIKVLFEILRIRSLSAELSHFFTEVSNAIDVAFSRHMDDSETPAIFDSIMRGPLFSNQILRGVSDALIRNRNHLVEIISILCGESFARGWDNVQQHLSSSALGSSSKTPRGVFLGTACRAHLVESVLRLCCNIGENYQDEALIQQVSTTSSNLTRGNQTWPSEAIVYSSEEAQICLARRLAFDNIIPGSSSKVLQLESLCRLACDAAVHNSLRSEALSFLAHFWNQRQLSGELSTSECDAIIRLASSPIIPALSEPIDARHTADWMVLSSIIDGSGSSSQISFFVDALLQTNAAGLDGMLRVGGFWELRRIGDVLVHRLSDKCRIASQPIDDFVSWCFYLPHDLRQSSVWRVIWQYGKDAGLQIGAGGKRDLAEALVNAIDRADAHAVERAAEDLSLISQQRLPTYVLTCGILPALIRRSSGNAVARAVSAIFERIPLDTRPDDIVAGGAAVLEATLRTHNEVANTMLDCLSANPSTSVKVPDALKSIFEICRSLDGPRAGKLSERATVVSNNLLNQDERHHLAFELMINSIFGLSCEKVLSLYLEDGDDGEMKSNTLASWILSLSAEQRVLCASILLEKLRTGERVGSSLVALRIVVKRQAEMRESPPLTSVLSELLRCQSLENNSSILLCINECASFNVERWTSFDVNLSLQALVRGLHFTARSLHLGERDLEHALQVLYRVSRFPVDLLIDNLAVLVTALCGVFPALFPPRRERHDEISVDVERLSQANAETVSRLLIFVFGTNTLKPGGKSAMAKQGSAVLLAFVRTVADPARVIRTSVRAELLPGLMQICDSITFGTRASARGREGEGIGLPVGLEEGSHGQAARDIWAATWLQWSRKRYTGRG